MHDSRVDSQLRYFATEARAVGSIRFPANGRSWCGVARPNANRAKFGGPRSTNSGSIVLELGLQESR